jgi:hypothetical protein
MPRDPQDPREPLSRPSGQEIRAGRLARVRMIRRRVATGAVVCFLAAWGVVYAQMRLGDDPALGTGTASAQVASTSSSSNTLATAASSTDSTASSDDSSASDTGTSSSSTMVTSQS